MVYSLSEGELYDKIYKLMHDSLNNGEVPSFREIKQILDDARSDLYIAWTAGPTYEDCLREVGIALKRQFGKDDST